jgi:hypothetical protein
MIAIDYQPMQYPADVALTFLLSRSTMQCPTTLPQGDNLPKNPSEPNANRMGYPARQQVTADTMPYIASAADSNCLWL